MKIIGLTGGIGSGKSTVAKLFSLLGVPVFDSDKSAKSVYGNPEVREQIIGLFGNEAYLGDEIDRAYLAEKIFSDETMRQKVNAIIHPAVSNAFQNWLIKQITKPYVIKESALIFELGLQSGFEKIILVTATEKLRIERIKRREHLNEEQIKQRMQAQWPDEKKLPLADFIINNNEEELIIPQVLKIHTELLAAKP